MAIDRMVGGKDELHFLRRKERGRLDIIEREKSSLGPCLRRFGAREMTLLRAYDNPPPVVRPEKGLSSFSSVEVEQCCGS